MGRAARANPNSNENVHEVRSPKPRVLPPPVVVPPGPSASLLLGPLVRWQPPHQRRRGRRGVERRKKG